MLDNKPIQLKLRGRESTNIQAILIEKGTGSTLGLLAWQTSDLKKSAERNQTISTFRDGKTTLIVIQIDKLGKKDAYKSDEEIRKAGVALLSEIKRYQIEKICISTTLSDEKKMLLLAEGILLANYEFNTYKSDYQAKLGLSAIIIDAKKIKQSELDEMHSLTTAVYFARTFVNEPVITLTAERFAEEMVKVGKMAKFQVKVLNKKAIIKENMGGLLSVNAGSQDPPTFTVMEYKPKKTVNKKPIILVGKGVVYDTGGLSLKPTAGSMDSMKSDMAGAAAVIGALYAIAKNNLPIHVIGLVPATDNRPGENATTPGDVITFRNGKTSEILNTDAEGRLILADALSYASDYDPELVIDLATLTGAQVMAMGIYGAAIMGTASNKVMDDLRKSGNNTYERVHEMPFWDEYGELIKSDIADIKNIGGKEAGCITAGKFLEHFVDYPWVHIDIAGPSFLNSNDSYRLKGGTGYGVRLLYDFIKSKI